MAGGSQGSLTGTAAPSITSHPHLHLHHHRGLVRRKSHAHPENYDARRTTRSRTNRKKTGARQDPPRLRGSFPQLSPRPYSSFSAGRYRTLHS
ncbi:hypothetical protein GBAR_LOCUS5960, partial [Geodia barretti]